MSPVRCGARPRLRPFAPATIVIWLLLGALSADVAHAAAAAQPLALEIDGPLFSGAPLVVELRQSGSLAGRRLAVQIAIDGASAGRFETTGDVTRITVDSVRLTPGTHEVFAKTGSVRATATVRVWPAWLPWVAAVVLLAIVGLGVARVLHRRRPGRAPA